MQNVTHRFITAIKLSVCLALAIGFGVRAQAEEKKADGKVDGTWAWTMAARNGGQERKMTLKLKTEGEKLTGKLSSPGREGTPTETEIKDGKVKGNEVSFTIVREFNGNTMTSKYNGKVTADVLKGKTSFERNGETQSRDWEAKRETEKKS